MTARRKADLSPHEKRVLALLLEGKSNGEIAEATHTKKTAVANTICRICRFYEVKGDRQLFKLDINSTILSQ